nr:MAG TPA: hypothetical protein [Crassvirales sp.]
MNRKVRLLLIMIKPNRNSCRMHRIRKYGNSIYLLIHM